MSTIVNTPSASGDNSFSGVAAIIVTILVLGSLFTVFYFYVLPRLNNPQSASTPSTIKVELPTPAPSPSPEPKQ